MRESRLVLLHKKKSDETYRFSTRSFSMKLEHLKLRAQPFHMRGRPSKFVQYASQQGAFRFIQNVLDSQGSIGLLYGAELSGKSVLIHRFFQEMPHDLTVAVVDGRGLNATQLLSSVLTQFGYDAKLNSTNELLSMLNIIAVHHTRATQSPVLVVESIGDMYPSALAALCKLAAFSNQGRFALRILFVGRNPIRRILKSDEMSAIAERFVGAYEMEPLTSKEALIYLYAKARSVGIGRPDKIFPIEICDELHLLSGGWPGHLDGIAISAINQADSFPIQIKDIVGPGDHDQSRRRGDLPVLEPDSAQDYPTLIVTMNGETLQECRVKNAKTLIGRSAYSDVFIDHKLISKYHALIFRDKGSFLLADLKSRNGTLLNSRRVNIQALRNDDIISLGTHRIKFSNASSRSRAHVAKAHSVDTVKMESLGDARRRKAGMDFQVASGEERNGRRGDVS